ncbi:MAG: MMPL family transporter [Desulfurivibrionaceae bacterium]
MRKKSLVALSVDHPKTVLLLSLLLALLFLSQFPKMTTDTNPKNMLPATSAVRVSNDGVEKTFGLYEDMLVLGISHDQGVINPATLAKVARISEAILQIDGVAARDVASFTTVDNVTVAEGALKVAPLMGAVPKQEAALAGLRRELADNPLFLNRLISADGKTTAIYIPLEKGANGKKIADRLREIVGAEAGAERYAIAGDPVARDTFGAEMFKLMGMFAPVAGMIMFAVAFFMFRSLFISMAIMAPAMIIIICSMGLIIGMGYPVHIMSSMSPVFLMAIATDSIHIFNEFYFRFREKGDRRAAILDTMRAVGKPLIYTDITTAVGFASLMLANIIPVKVFGFGVAFGTMLLLLLSFTLVPALLTFIRLDKVKQITADEDPGTGKAALLLMGLSRIGGGRPRATLLVVALLTVFSVIGLSRVHVNNNMVEWFKPGSEIRKADRVLNQALGGTSLAYVVVGAGEDEFMKNPEALRYIEGLQRRLETLPVVGKTFSVVDYVKRINLVLHDNDPKFDAIPETKEMIGQYLFLFAMSAKPSDLNNVVDYPFRQANIQVQLKTWDARAMRQVIAAMEEYAKAHPLPLTLKPAGIAYFNLVWNNEVLMDMVKGFLAALVMVFIILAINFRSLKWALLSYVPLLFTILLLYGVIGFVGKDFDMPISVLSCLSLGMAVDFAIHFVGRFRLRRAERQEVETLADSLAWTAARPGKGIMRNVLLFAAAFSVMLFAPLTPYITVGAFIVSMMFLSALMTIICLPAIIVMMQGRFAKGE